MFQEYGDMVETVKKLERETSNWRQIVEWPSYDTPFAPQNIKDIIEDQNIYEGNVFFSKYCRSYINDKVSL